MERIVLITNLLDVSIDTSFGKVHTHTNALVLSDRGTDGTGPRYRVHGFHNEVANPTFDMTLPSFDWAIEPQSHKRSFVLCVAGAPSLRIALLTDFANDEPLDIERWDVPDGGRGAWGDAGDALPRKVLRYYHAPYFILGQQLDADEARRILGVESVEKIRRDSR